MNILGKIILLAVTCVSCASCLPTSQTPLSDPAKAALDRRLLGVWTGTDNDEPPTYLHIVRASGGIVDAIVVVNFDDGAEVSLYKAFTTVLDGRKFLNIRQQSRDRRQLLQAYMFGAYEIDAGGVLNLRLLGNTPYLQQAIKNGLVKGVVQKTGRLISISIAESPDKFADFVKKTEAKKLFGEEPIKFTRMQAASEKK